MIVQGSLTCWKKNLYAPILSQKIQSYVLSAFVFKMHFNIIPQSASGSSKFPLWFIFYLIKPRTYFSSPPCVQYVPPISYCFLLK